MEDVVAVPRVRRWPAVFPGRRCACCRSKVGSFKRCYLLCIYLGHPSGGFAEVFEAFSKPYCHGLHFLLSICPIFSLAPPFASRFLGGTSLSPFGSFLDLWIILLRVASHLSSSCPWIFPSFRMLLAHFVPARVKYPRGALDLISPLFGPFWSLLFYSSWYYLSFSSPACHLNVCPAQHGCFLTRDAYPFSNFLPPPGSSLMFS